MIELGVIVALVALLGWEKYQNRKERAKMLNAIISKDNQEMVNLELADKTEVKAPNPQPQDDWMPVEAMEDEEYAKMIKQSIPKTNG